MIFIDEYIDLVIRRCDGVIIQTFENRRVFEKGFQELCSGIDS